MAEDNAFARILNRMTAADTSVSEKTASASSAPETDAATRMVNTVRAVTAAKTASAASTPSPKATLEKMAAEAAQAEEAQLLKQAQFMGAALADGFMERFAQYDAALSSVKVAGTAEISPTQLKQAEAAGYARAVHEMEKTAAAEFEAGYNDQLQEIHKIAADIHYIGQQTAQSLIEQARNAK